MTDRPGDDFLREHGIALPCAEQFGWYGLGTFNPELLRRCDRPYGHTGPHMAEGFTMSGIRKSSDDARTNEVLRQIAERPTRP